MNKVLFKNIFRNLGVIRVFDNIRFQLLRIINFSANQKYKKENPHIPIPPDYILYEAHQINYASYISNGLNNAKKLKKLFEKYIDLKDKKVLDWGCGPARIIRHFPNLIKNATFFGADYNEVTIAWNKDNIKGPSFFVNGLNPPSSIEDNFFDAIYGLSVFTHLSLDNHFNWVKELNRITKKNAVLILTTQGEVYKIKLFGADLEKFNSNKIVIQGNTKEGHRTFSAFHPPKAIRLIFEKYFEVLEHIPGKVNNWGLSQDIWVLKNINFDKNNIHSILL